MYKAEQSLDKQWGKVAGWYLYTPVERELERRTASQAALHATRHHNRLSSDVGRILAGQEGHCRRHVARGAQPAHQRAALVGFLQLWAGHQRRRKLQGSGATKQAGRVRMSRMRVVEQMGNLLLRSRAGWAAAIPTAASWSTRCPLHTLVGTMPGQTQLTRCCPARSSASALVRPSSAVLLTAYLREGGAGMGVVTIGSS